MVDHPQFGIAAETNRNRVDAHRNMTDAARLGAGNVKQLNPVVGGMYDGKQSPVGATIERVDRVIFPI